MLPVHAASHDASTIAADTSNGEGSSINAVAVEVQPLASVIVTKYVPAHKPVACADPCPDPGAGSQLNTYGAVTRWADGSRTVTGPRATDRVVLRFGKITVAGETVAVPKTDAATGVGYLDLVITGAKAGHHINILCDGTPEPSVQSSVAGWITAGECNTDRPIAISSAGDLTIGHGQYLTISIRDRDGGSGSASIRIVTNRLYAPLQSPVASASLLTMFHPATRRTRTVPCHLPPWPKLLHHRPGNCWPSHSWTR